MSTSRIAHSKPRLSACPLEVKELALTLTDEESEFYHTTPTNMRNIYLEVILSDDPVSWSPTPLASKLTEAKTATDRKQVEKAQQKSRPPVPG